MTPHERRRTDPVVTRAYTVPVVREVPIQHGSSAPGSAPQGIVSAGDSNAW